MYVKANFWGPDVDPATFGLNRMICMSRGALDARSRRRHREVFFIEIHRVVFAGDGKVKKYFSISKIQKIYKWKSMEISKFQKCQKSIFIDFPL